MFFRVSLNGFLDRTSPASQRFTLLIVNKYVYNIFSQKSLRWSNLQIIKKSAHRDAFIHYDNGNQSSFRTARKAFWGTSTEPMRFMRFLPAFCFSSSLRLREMSPP